MIVPCVPCGTQGVFTVTESADYSADSAEV